MQIYKRVMALDPCQNFVSAQYLRLNEGNLKIFCIWIDIDKLWFGIVVQIYNRAMALKSCLEFLFLLLITRMNGWNLTNSVINVVILACYKTSLDFVNISESVISGRLFLSYNGPEQGHLCHT